MFTSARSRCPRFQSAEKKLLISKYKHIVENKKTDGVTNDEKTKTWSQIANEFNSVCASLHLRSVESLVKLWKNSKKVVRQQAAQERQERIKTGGGAADIVKKDENYDSILAIVNEKTVCGLSNPFDSNKSNTAKEKADNAGENMYEGESEGLWHSHLDSEVIELIVEESDLDEDANNENEEIVLDESSDNNHTKRKINGNLDHENFTWKKHKPSDLQEPLNRKLQAATSCASKKNFDTSRRRPTMQMKALTSSHVAERYESLLEKRISIADYQLQLLKNQVSQQEEEHNLKIELLKIKIKNQK